jgi:ApaG protein
VGHQPLLNPGETFEYSSWAQFATPMGSMRGRYFCITHDAHWFEAEVGEFALADAAALH